MSTTRQLSVIAVLATTGLAGTIGVVAASSGSAVESDEIVAAPIPREPTDSVPRATAAGPPAAEVSIASTDGSTAGELGDAVESATDETAPGELGDAVESATDEAAPDDPEPPAPGEPGVFDGDDSSSPPPPPPPPLPPSGPTDLTSVPPPTPPVPPIPGPVDLVTPPIGPGPQPLDDLAAPTDPTPFDVATDFQAAPVPNHVGSITSEFSGCQLDCVTTALLSANPTNPNLRLDATTTVPVHFEVEVSEVDGSWTEYFNNSGYDTGWSTTLGPLEPDTTYDLTMFAIDTDGHTKVLEHRFTSTGTIDGFADVATGCQLECLTVGTVERGDAANSVKVHLESNSPAELDVWFSTSEPTWVDDPDAKPAIGPVYENDTPSTDWTFEIDDLEFARTYHVVARAHDEHGEHYRVGTFRTGVEPTVDVLVTFEEVTITHDGDPGALNRAEIRLSWGFDGTRLGGRSEEKMNPKTIELAGDVAQWFRFDPTAGSVPNPTVGAHERDWDGLIEWCSYGTGPGTEPSYVADCDMRTNVAHHGGPVSLEQIMAFPTCAEAGVQTSPGARCVALGSSVFGTDDEDYAHFTTFVSFLVVD